MKSRSRALALFLFLILFPFAAAFAQTPSPSPTPAPPPVNDIFLIDVANKNAQLTFGKPSKITEWNGYNNQPFFFPDGQSLFYTSIRADKQADIYRYEIKSGKTARFTETTESEYSPTVTPDAKFISVVRVEADGTQRLWKFPLGGGKPSLILEKIKPVGYQAWIDQNTLALFILGAAGKPSTLQIVDVRTEKAEVIAENIGRPLRLIPNQNKLSFVHKISADEWIVKSFDLQTRQITALIKTLPRSEDYAWTPSGILLMAKDAKLFAWNPAKDTGWHEVADFSPAGLKSITRLAVSPKGNRIAIVAR
jgi:dipeptidyl aminopeptidase/acylaminoacyl peptidase